MKKKRVAAKKPTKKTKTKKRPVVFSDSTDAGRPVEQAREDRLRAQQAALGVMAQAIHAEGEQEADYTERLNKKYGR